MDISDFLILLFIAYSIVDIFKLYSFPWRPTYSYDFTMVSGNNIHLCSSSSDFMAVSALNVCLSFIVFTYSQIYYRFKIFKHQIINIIANYCLFVLNWFCTFVFNKFPYFFFICYKHFDIWIMYSFWNIYHVLRNRMTKVKYLYRYYLFKIY